jgi:ABC-type transporter Mla MlaB component
MTEVVQKLLLVGMPILSITACRDWQRDLDEALNSQAVAIDLDMSGVEKIDTACLQLLTAFVLQARANDIALRWHEPSEHFLSAVNSLNLNAALGIEL